MNIQKQVCIMTEKRDGINEKPLGTIHTPTNVTFRKGLTNTPFHFAAFSSFSKS
jgi:hypothetical protein